MSRVANLATISTLNSYFEVLPLLVAMVTVAMTHHNYLSTEVLRVSAHFFSANFTSMAECEHL